VHGKGRGEGGRELVGFLADLLLRHGRGGGGSFRCSCPKSSKAWIFIRPERKITVADRKTGLQIRLSQKPILSLIGQHACYIMELLRLRPSGLS
jgi:hypothetical protein